MTPLDGRVTIIVKALPQPSKRFGETVCCAGVTADRQWKRLYPIRFRHLNGLSSFSRWDTVTFRYVHPSRDARAESCHVFEDSIQVAGSLPASKRAALLDPMLIGSAAAAMAEGRSLALIRPRNTRFYWKRKSAECIDAERQAFRQAASQTAMFDKELAELNPSPFEFRFRFEDEAGSHNYENGDWEAHAMYWREERRTGEAEALKWMSGVFNDQYPRRGMTFAIGNQAKRPHVWQLLAG